MVKKRAVCALLAGMLLLGTLCLAEDGAEVFSPAPDVTAPSAILTEKRTGQVLFEKNADERLEPASVTKIMTILLIVEALEDGRLTLDESVTASARAASMGGSQIFLAEGESMSVRDMLKAIVVASANDAAVAMAEKLAGTEEAFTALMNERAQALGMTNTVFKNCTGLPDDREHLTTARDISLMARELISHEEIKDYTTLWTDTLRGGEFGLSNTNKLIRFYDGATGLKTGYTSRAGHCLAATAERGGVEYIAVVLHCQSSEERFESAKALLSYAFSAFTLYEPTPERALPPVRVVLGEKPFVRAEKQNVPPLLLPRGGGEIERRTELESEVPAPVAAGDELGLLTVTQDGKTLAEIPLLAAEDSPKLTRFRVWLMTVGAMYAGRGFGPR